MSAADPLKQGVGEEPRVYEPSMEEILASIRRIIADDQSLPSRTLVRENEAGLRAVLEPASSRREAPAVQEDAASGGTAAMSASVEPPALRGAVDPVNPSLRQASTPRQAPLPPPTSKTEAPAPRVVAAATTLGHIAAPQFAMPDVSMLRGVAQPKRDGEAGDAAEPSRATLSRAAPAAPTPQPELALAEVPAPPQSRSQSDVDRPVSPRPPQRALEATKEETAHAMSSLFSTSTDQTVAAAFNTLAATRLVDNEEALKTMASDMIRPLLKSWLDDNLPNLVEKLVRAEIERVGRGGR